MVMPNIPRDLEVTIRAGPDAYRINSAYTFVLARRWR